MFAIPNTDNHAPLKITVIHQWWLETEELARLLFSRNAAYIEMRFYPYVTDCSGRREINFTTQNSSRPVVGFGF